MKALLVMALASLCATAALADEIPTDVASQHTAIVEEYTYATDLDIAKVEFHSECLRSCSSTHGI